MHRQIKDWSTWRLQKLIWLTANSFSRLNITRLDCHNNTPFSKPICVIERYSKKWAKSNRITTNLTQGWQLLNYCFLWWRPRFFRSSQAIESFGIKLADLETFNKFWHCSFCSWAELDISTQEKVVDFVKNNSRSVSGATGS